MTGIWSSFAVVVACFIQVNAQTTFGTDLVLHTSRVTWQAASNICRDLHPKGRLVTLDTPAKADLLRQFKRRAPWQVHIEDDYWIGLYKTDLSGGDLIWTGQCSPLGIWSNWAGTDVNSTVGRCARTRLSDDKWVLHNCTDSAPFVCEIPTEDQCVFNGLTLKTVPTASHFPDKKIQVLREFMNTSLCDVECLSAVYQELECWLWRMDGQDCVMYLANSTIILDATVNATFQTFLKVCFTALVSTDNRTTGPNEIVAIPDDCRMTTSTIPLTTVDTTTNRSTVAITIPSSAQQTTPSTTANTSSSTTTTSTPTVAITTKPLVTTTTTIASIITTIQTESTKTSAGPPITTEDDAQIVTLSFQYPNETTPAETTTKTSTTIASLDLPDVTNQTTTTTTNAPTTTAKKRVVASFCECFCESNTISLPAPTLSPEEKQVFVIQIVQSLTLNKSEISSVRRKFISVRDPRTSARNVGILGISLLSIVFGGIFILDINSLVRDVKTLFGNVKSGLGFTDLSKSYHVDTEKNRISDYH